MSTKPLILNDLTAQKERIDRAFVRLGAVPGWYWKDSKEYLLKLQGFACAAQYSNTINGDYQSAEGALGNLIEALERIEERIADWGSDLDV